jgi:hypothetical protein
MLEHVPAHPTQILPCIQEICSAYTPAIRPRCSPDPRKSLFRLLKLFFVNDSSWDILSLVKSALSKNTLDVLPSTIFTWLSEWSKRKYREIVDLDAMSQRAHKHSLILQQY